MANNDSEKTEKGVIIAVDCDIWDEAIENPSSDKLKLYENMKSITAQMLSRLAKNELTLSFVSIRKNDKEEEKHYVLQALQHSKLALELYPNSLDSLKWFCASAGSATAFVSSKERANLGSQIKENLEKAIALKPDDPLLHFIYGRWAYEVSGLRLFGIHYSSLKSSYLEALDWFTKADAFKSKWKINSLWIAKVLIEQKNYSQAMTKIEEALTWSTVTEEDFVAYKELSEVQKKCSKHINTNNND